MSATPAPRRPPTLLIVVLIAALVICCCCGSVWLLTRGPAIRLMCRVSDTFCAAFCRQVPGECLRLNLPPSR